jgi:outer membrane protein OmpA-like peptidoglycan-associated protein
MNWMKSIVFAAVGVFAVAFFGCAHTVPAELAQARAAYQRSSEGPAARLVPAELHKAKMALAQAEKSFDDKPASFQTRDLAYVALRKCETADALASIAADQGSTVQAKADYSTLQGDIVTRTKAELSEARTDLSQSRTALMAALAKLAAVKEEERGLVITLSGSVLFKSGESTLMPAAQARLDQVAEALLTSPDRGLVVEGHTDSQGSDEDNRALSQRRADAVRSYLIGRGYAADRITAEGLGEGRPIADNGTPEGRSNNRRVEIIIQRATPGRAGSSR